MSKTNFYIIQLHAVMLLLGYWLFHSLFSLAFGQSDRAVSIFYDGIQAVVSLYVLLLCRKDFMIERGRSFLSFFSILLILYSFRMIYDMALGPFVSSVPQQWFINDILYIVFGTFLTVWAFIESRKWIDIKIIVKLVFWMSFIIALAVIINLITHGIETSYEDERLNAGQGLGTLALVKIGAILVLSAMHSVINKQPNLVIKILYIIGIIMGCWIMLASGSRGGVVGVVVALGVYLIASSRKNATLISISMVVLIIIIMNIVPILIWISDYFPIFGQRMLNTILENDQSFRQEIRAKAINVIIDNPIWGYSYRLFPSPSGFRAHNGILEVFIALGIPIGLLFTYFVYIKGFVLSFKIMLDKHFFFPSTLCVFALVSSLSSSSVSSNVFCFAVCLLGCIYYYRRI